MKSERKLWQSIRRPALIALAAICAVQAAGPGFAAAENADAAKPLKATLERLGTFAYVGDPLQIRVAVFNTSEQAFDNAKGLDLMHGLLVGDATGAAASIPRKAGVQTDKRSQPSVLAPGEFFGFIADLRDLYDGLDKPGKYIVRLALDEVSSDPVHLAIIPRYDPKTRYRASIETDFGQISFDLLGAEAPAHVQNFYDLASQGFYDGSYFITVMKGVQMIGGDSSGDGRSTPGYDLPLEITQGLKHARGTLSMLRKQDTDHGSQFVVSLGANPMMDGNFSIFGVQADGEDTLKALENLPTTGRSERPYYRPLKELKIVSVKVAPAPEGSKATSADKSSRATGEPE